MRRRLVVSAAAILVILALAWSGGWFWLARWADQTTTTTLAELAQQGVEVDCQNRDIIGFPFALRLACAETAVAEQSTETKASLAGLTGGASIFAPMTARVAMTSPAHLNSARLGAADIQWKSAGVGVGLGMNGPRDVSFDAADLLAAFSVPDLPVQKVVASSAAGSLQPSANGGTDIAVSFTDLGVSLGNIDLPLVSGSAAGELSVPPRALIAGRAAMQAPVWARAIDILLASGGAKFSLTGDISIDAEGIVDGAITLRIAGVDALPAFIAALPTRIQKHGFGFVGAVIAMGRQTTLEGEPASELTVEIDRSAARIGSLELFTIPPVPL